MDGKRSTGERVAQRLEKDLGGLGDAVERHAHRKGIAGGPAWSRGK